MIDKNRPNRDRVFIYTLSHPITNEIRYIGKTEQSLYNRYCEHVSLKNSRNNLNYHSKNWIKSLLRNNLKPKIELLDIVNKDNWENEEIFYISYFKYLGFNLTNHQKGGGKGNLGLNWKISEEKIKNRIYKLEQERINKHILYDLNGNIVKIYNNIIVASKDLNIKYTKLYNYIKTKTLIDKTFILLKEDQIFNNDLLKQKYRRVKISNNIEEIIFNSQRECADYLKLSFSTFNRIINNKKINKTSYKIELI